MLVWLGPGHVVLLLHSPAQVHAQGVGQPRLCGVWAGLWGGWRAEAFVLLLLLLPQLYLRVNPGVNAYALVSMWMLML